MLALLLRYQHVIQLLLLIGLLLFARRAWLAWQGLQSATFRLEEEHARQRLQQSVIGLLVQAGLMLFFFFLTTLPVEPASRMATAEDAGAVVAAETPALTPTPSPSPLEEGLALPESRCDPQSVAIVQPAEGDTVQGEIDIRGTATAPNFGFYKVEFAPAERPLFLTIDVGRQPKVDDVLVQDWDTSLLPPGDYWLQLVVVDNAGNALPPCRIRFTVRAGGNP